MKKLFGLLWVILIGIFLIGCDSIDDTVAPIQEDVLSLQETVQVLQEQLDQMQEAQASNATIIAQLQEDLSKIDTKDTAEILRWIAKYDEMLDMLLEEYTEWVKEYGVVQAEYTAQFNMEYRNTLTMDNYEDIFQLTIPSSGTIYIVINTNRKIDINFYYLGDSHWFDYTTFTVSSMEVIHFEAGTYLFEVQNWYDYNSVTYTIQFNQATF